MPTRKKRFSEPPLFLTLNPKPLSSSSSLFQPISMEIDGFLYETLQPLSSPTTTDSSPLFNSPLLPNSPDLNSPDEHQYSVLRNQVHSSTLTCPSSSSPTAAIDFFSLDVVDEDVGIRTPTPTPIIESPVTEVKVNTELERNLEKGWFRANSKFKSPMLQLHKEILDFCKFLSPTPEEEVLRNEAVDGVFGVVKYIWPHCKVEVFGSFKTGLYLPTSDIDVVIFDSQVKTPQMGLIALSRALSQKGIAKKIQVIAKARVPIIKFIEKRSGVAFDISFDVDNGPKAAVFIKDAVRKIPPLRPLCLILKVFLQQRELNEVYSGGIGSYALLTMLIAQLQMHWKGQYFQGWNASLEQNLGVLLVNFFEFYGRKLNIWDVGVSCKAAGTFFLKNKKGFLNGDRPHLLSIEDPQAPENDIGKNSYNYSQIRSAFGMAFSTLTSAKTILNLGPNRSILGTIIRPDRLLLERKGGVNGEMTFESLLPGAGEPVHSRQHGEQEVVGNWQFNEDEEEPFPRGNLVLEDRSHSSKKRKKAWKEKRISLSNGEEVTQLTGENKKKKSSKKRWRSNNNEDARYSGGNGSGPFVSGSPYGRSR